MSEYKNNLKSLTNLKKDIKIAFISAEFNKDLVESLEKVTENFLEKNYFEVSSKFYVPWALEIPAMLKRVLKKENYDLVYCFWVVIRWETTHYEIVTNESSRWIMDMALKFTSTWIIMWILTCENKEQVEKRINESLAISGLNLLSEIKKLW